MFWNDFLELYLSDLVKMSYYHLKSTFYLHDVTFRILSGGLVINMVALLSSFFAKKKGWEWMKWKYILIPWTPGPPHLILAHPHTHDIYTRLIFIIAKKAVVLQIKFSSLLKISNFDFLVEKREKLERRTAREKQPKLHFLNKNEHFTKKNCQFHSKTNIFGESLAPKF